MKRVFLLFFAVSLILEMPSRYYYRAASSFTISQAEIACMLVISLLIINLKGIRIILLGVFILLITLSIRNMLLFHTTSRESLPLSRVFRFFWSNGEFSCFIHQILYIFLISLLFIKKPGTNQNKLA
ncbi:MAG: hypothetical protein ACO1N0_19235 [Fluviicola sp.]